MIFELILISIVTYYFWHWTFWKRRGLPGPWGVPIFGKAGAMLEDSFPPGYTLQKWTKEYGKIYGFTEGMQKVMVISDPDLVQEILVKQYDNFYGRKHNPVQGDPDKDKDIHIVGAQGFRWKRLRTITAPAFSNGSIKKVLTTMEDSTQELMKKLREESENGKAVNMHLFYQEYTFDVISRVAMGQPDSQMFKNPLLKDVKGFFEHNRWQIWMFSGGFPFAVSFLKWLFIKVGKFGAGPFIVVQKSVTDAVMSRIAQREADKKHGVEPGEAADYIDMFLNARAEVEHFGESNDEFHKSSSYNNRQLTTQEIISQCFVFLVAGFDTTAISLSYVTYFLALNPKIQSKLQDEVDKECPNDEITFDQLSKLKYMDNVIKESLRLFPFASFANSRRCMRNTVIGEQIVEAGVDVMIDTWTLHHDKNVWGNDVEEFKPERWDSPLTPQQAYLSFGAGPRVCLGMRFALLEQKGLLSHILKKYTFETNAKTQLPIKLVGRATARPENLFLSLKPRV